MTTESSRETIRHWFDLLTKGDPGAADLFADDLRYRLIGSTPLSGHIEGKDAFVGDFLARIASLTKEPIQLTLDRLIADGDTVVALARGQAEGAHGPYNNNYAMIFDVQDGRISRLEEYCDTSLIEQALFGRTLQQAAS